LIDQGKISGKIAKTIFEEMLRTGTAPEIIMREKGLEQVSDSSSIEKAVDDVLAANSQQVADYRSGKDKVFGFLVGQVMKATQGKASPQMVNEVLRKKLEDRR
jgi:aspartyl-tRNA(Asn)/glutamyl-tRNA(Gln) amidotransferase subunit B